VQGKDRRGRGTEIKGVGQCLYSKFLVPTMTYTQNVYVSSLHEKLLRFLLKEASLI